MRIEMPAEVEGIIGKIREHGFEAFAVGGCVRDSLLFRTPEDWDITTSARPEEVKGIFSRTVDTGIEHGTVTVIKNRHGYEVTTYRIDGEYRDCRHPDFVEFTSNLKEDLKRRDFTINAMAYSHETGIVDAFGGMDDLKAGVIRCVGKPLDRFTEDALRILRAIRFAAQLGFEIEEETYRAISGIAPNLSKVSKERIQVELTKLLLSDHPEKIIMVRETGISKYAADSFDDVFRSLAEMSPALLGIGKLSREKSLRWAGFLRRTEPEKAKRFLKSLKLDNETIDNAKAMIGVFQTEICLKKPQIRRILSRVTEYQFEGALALKEMDSEPEVEKIRMLWKEIIEGGDCVRQKDLAVSGEDLIKAGMKPGKKMGETLKYLFDLVLENPELNKKEILLEKLSDSL